MDISHHHYVKSVTIVVGKNDRQGFSSDTGGGAVGQTFSCLYISPLFTNTHAHFSCKIDHIPAPL